MRLVSRSLLAVVLPLLEVISAQNQVSRTPRGANLHNSLYCPVFANMNSCVRALSTTGGYAIVPPGSKLNLTSTLDVGNENGVPTVLEIQRGGQIIVNVGGGTPAIRLHKGAMLKCDRGAAQLRDMQGVPEIVMGPAANITDLVVNATVDGSQQSASIEGCYFFDPGGNTGTITGAVVHWKSLAANTFMRDTFIEAFPTKQIEIENSSGVYSSSYDLDNVLSNCDAVAHCEPLVIQADPTGAPSAIRINGGQYEHAGPGLAMIDCEGSGQSGLEAPFGITIVGTYLEPSESTNALGIKLRDCHDISINGLFAAGTGGTDMINISESAKGLVYNISVRNVYNRGFRHSINDQINSRRLAERSVGDYEFSAVSRLDKVIVQTYLAPPIGDSDKLAVCTSRNEGSHAVATSCSEACVAGQRCTTGGSLHCEIYCNGSEYVETGR